ncbi:MAG: hypothetical protein KDK40_03265 [Chlamydiia bacterium]|nr:hypothetical protein [Chlamydiia bacterium]
MKKQIAETKIYQALLKKIARLEFMNDQLLSELLEADAVFRSVGFEEGLKTAKAAAQELFEE